MCDEAMKQKQRKKYGMIRGDCAKPSSSGEESKCVSLLENFLTCYSSNKNLKSYDVGSTCSLMNKCIYS